ncbi:hypothetical protein [Flammeovirga aprica]|uniref:Lipoprotein n=1 Tax=Flammeovirga aprica JL-4 TaxID=694437 RepID=A0A7X9RZR5_9BACT|nr:hypothetical protein [Flammeovirga aprica]NME71708.1 hypothetical protein [Flammeovirga aprica JL-4]
MINLLKKSIALGILLICFSCNGPQDYISWVENPQNDLIQTEKSGDIQYKVSCVPPRYKALRKNGLEGFKSKRYFQDLEELKGTTSFLIDITLPKAFIESYTPTKLKDYIAFQLGGNCSLQQGEKRFTTEYYTIESGFAKKNSYRLNLLFPAQELDEEEEFLLIIQDKLLGNAQFNYSLIDEKEYYF